MIFTDDYAREREREQPLPLFNVSDTETDWSVTVFCSLYHTPRSWSEMSERCHAQELSEASRRAFITPDLWPPNIHDLNPVDFKNWAIIQQRVNRTKEQNVNDLMQRLIDVWAMSGTERYYASAT